jgi:hypothetical protein
MKKLLVVLALAFSLISAVPAQAANPGLVPSTGQVSATVGGFSVQVYNYDTNFTWTVTSTLGTATINSIGTVTVFGLGNFPATLTITTSRAGYDNGIKSITASAIAQKVQITPVIYKRSQTNDSFSAYVGNFSSLYMWSAASSAGRATMDANGNILVSGLTRGQKATLTVSAFQPGLEPSTATLDWSSLQPNSSLIPDLGKVMMVNGTGFSVPITNYDSYYQWKVGCENGNVTISNQGVINVTNVDPSKPDNCKLGVFDGSISVGGTSFTGYSSAAALSIKPDFGAVQPNRSGFTVQINNYNPQFRWDAVASGASAVVNGKGVLEVTGMRGGGSTTVTISVSIGAGMPVTKSSVNGSSFPTQGLVPEFSEITSTNDGFQVKITNYNRFYDYGIEVSSGNASVDSSGLVTVSGLGLGESAAVTVFTSKGTVEGDQSGVEGSALLTVIAPKPGKPPVIKVTKKPTTSKPTPTKKPSTGGPVISVGGGSTGVKTIICVNGSAKRFVTSANPVCPAGFTKQ